MPTMVWAGRIHLDDLAVDELNAFILLEDADLGHAVVLVAGEEAARQDGLLRGLYGHGGCPRSACPHRHCTAHARAFPAGIGGSAKTGWRRCQASARTSRSTVSTSSG